MQSLGYLFRGAELPFPGAVFPAGALGEIGRHTLDIDDGVAHEHAGQAVGEVAGEAGIAALMQFEEEVQGALRSGEQGHPDIIGPVFRVAEQSFEKLRSALRRKDFVHAGGGKDLFVAGHWGDISLHSY